MSCKRLTITRLDRNEMVSDLFPIKKKKTIAPDFQENTKASKFKDLKQLIREKQENDKK